MDRSLFRGLLWLLAIGGAICTLLYLFVFDMWIVPADDAMFTASIMPTLFPQDRILTRRGGEPSFGQLARCASPDGSAGYVVGRVMGMSGDNVEIREERVYVNGKLLPSRHQCPPVVMSHPIDGREVTLSCHVAETGAWSFSYLLDAEHPEGTRTAKVEPGKLFLVSDNHHLHNDSRDFGLVDASTCEHVVFRLWGESFTDASRRFNLLY